LKTISVLKWLLSFVFPGKCMFCDKEMRMGIGDVICTRCQKTIKLKGGKRCLLCQRELFGAGDIKLCSICEKKNLKFDVNYAPFNYTGEISSAIKRFKFAKRAWYGKYFAEFMADELKDKKIRADYIVYPPVNRKTYIERGYNQSEVLAQFLSKKLEVPCIRRGIYKLRQNEKQSLQKRETRFSNVRGVFALTSSAKKLIKGKNIIFADDILTTGATASECADILKKAGALTVISVTIATTEG